MRVCMFAQTRGIDTHLCHNTTIMWTFSVNGCRPMPGRNLLGFRAALLTRTGRCTWCSLWGSCSDVYPGGPGELRKNGARRLRKPMPRGMGDLPSVARYANLFDVDFKRQEKERGMELKEPLHLRDSFGVI